MNTLKTLSTKILSYIIYLGFALVLIFVGYIGFSITTHQVTVETHDYQITQRIEVARFASQLLAEVELEVNKRLFTTTALKSFVVENEFIIDDTKFREFSASLADEMGGIKSLQLAPNAVVTHVYPLNGNEDAVGHNLLQDDIRKEAVLKTIENNEYAITGPIELLQSGEALIARLPIYFENETTSSSTLESREGQLFWGFATVLIDIEVIYELVSNYQAEGEFDIAIKGRHGLGVDGEVFFGNEDIFLRDPVTVSVQLPVGSWEIGVVPFSGWEEEAPITPYVWIVGLLTTFILSILLLAVFFLLRSKLLIKDIENEFDTVGAKQGGYLFGIGIFAVCICLTVAAVFVTTAIFAREAEQMFINQTQLVAENIKDRSDIYINVLEGGVGLFAASVSVERNEWKAYVDSLDIQENYPGIQGVGYSVFVPPEELEEHIKSIRSEGFPDFTVRPEGERELYSSIIYLEPFDLRNQQAFGFDMYQESNRRAAMEQARDTGEAALSQKITLVQEIDDDVQAGFLMYVPQYKNDIDVETFSDTQNSIEGYVYSAFRARDFIEGVLGSGGVENIALKIYDANNLTDDGLLYDDTAMHDLQNATESRFTTLIPVTLAGHTWQLEFYSTTEYGVTRISKVAPIITMSVGLLISLLVSAVFYALSVSRRRAVVIANKMTGNYKRQQQRMSSFNSIVTMPELQLAERIDKTLNIVRTELDLDIGIVSRIDGDKYVVEHVVAPKDVALTAGDIFKLGNTYCALTFEQNNMVTIHDATATKYDSHPCHVEFGLEAYIGTPLVINGKKYGTVNFSSSKAHAAFSENDRAFVELAVRWIARMIENQQTDRSKDEFVSLASHQLRTPLSIINWYSEVLADPGTGKLNETQQEYVYEISEGNRRITELVNSLLNVSRLDLGTFKVEPEKLSFSKVLTAIKKQYQPMLKEKKIVFKSTVDPDVDNIVADSTVLQLIVDNLISNAIKYTPQKGEVSVSVEKKTKKRFLLTVQDTGFGIPEDEQDKMFSKMFRATNIALEETDGTGLGLYMTKTIVEALGGSIDFTSEVNKGTTFSVVMPLVLEKKDGTSRLS